jgi:hypothetical protein
MPIVKFTVLGYHGDTEVRELPQLFVTDLEKLPGRFLKAHKPVGVSMPGEGEFCSLRIPEGLSIYPAEYAVKVSDYKTALEAKPHYPSKLEAKKARQAAAKRRT